MSQTQPDGKESWDVLVVDDEPVVLEGVKRILEAEGYRVATAPDGRSALAHPAATSCRLVLCDLMLPDLPGTDVLRSLRSMRSDLPLAMITGYATAWNASKAIETGASGFLAKPFDEAELLALVRRLLSREPGAGQGDAP